MEPPYGSISIERSPITSRALGSLFEWEVPGSTFVEDISKEYEIKESFEGILASSQDKSGIYDRRRLGDGEEMARVSIGIGTCSWFSQMSEAATEAARRGRLFELR